MKIKYLKIVLAAVGAMGAMQVQAQQAEPITTAPTASGVRWDLGMGWDGGGEKLASVDIENSGSTSVRTNGGVNFSIGAAFANDAARQFETVMSLGYKFSGATGDNGKVGFSSMPISVTQFFRPNDMRIGVGASYYLEPKYKVDIDGSSGNGEVKFDSPVGYHAQIGWAPKNQTYGVDLRYTSAKFQPKGFTDKIDGSGIGLVGNIRF